MDKTTELLGTITGFLNEGKHMWEEAATYPDMQKEVGVGQFFNWHFANVPVYEVPEGYEAYPRNVSFGIKESIKVLMTKETPKKEGFKADL